MELSKKLLANQQQNLMRKKQNLTFFISKEANANKFNPDLKEAQRYFELQKCNVGTFTLLFTTQKEFTPLGVRHMYRAN